ncbi:MAG: LysR family transcriptional regulator [Solirubrobacteraceae bacterium]
MNDDAIDPRTLRALVAIAEAGSFRAAARAMGYTQSAVSHQIATIERRLGVSVFVRPGGRGRITLTPHGELVHRHAQRVLAANQALDADIRAALAGERGTLRIGLSQSTCAMLVGPLAQLRRNNPEIEVSLINAGTAEALAQQLSLGQIDIGLYVNVEPDERVITTPLFEDTWTVIAHRDDALAASPSITFDALEGLQMIAWHQRWRSQAGLERLWRRRGIRPRIVYRTDDNLMIQMLVANGLGCACLGALAASELIDPRLRRLALRDEVPPRTLALCQARSREPPAAAVALIEAIRRLAAPDPAASMTP